MNVSQRATKLQASPIRKLVPYSIEAKRNGKEVHHLNIGQPDLFSPQSSLDALKEFHDKVIAYTHSQGDKEYIDALVEFYHSQKIDVNHTQINVTTGGSEAIVFAFFATMNPGDEVLVAEPFYTNYNAFAEMAGVIIKPIMTHGADGFHISPIESIESHITEKTKAILICNPGNPTGTVFSNYELKQLAKIVQMNDLWLIADEVYREFAFHPEDDRITSILQIREIDDRSIVIDSVSKRFSMCGARLGCLMSRNPKIMDATLKLSQARLCSPQIEQRIAIAAHQNYLTYIPAILEEYKKRRDIVYNTLLEIPNVQVSKPEGSLYILPQLPIEDSEHFAKWLLTDFSIDQETVMVAPAQGFYATEGAGKNKIRIAYVLDTVRLQRAMNILKEALQAYPHTL